jgi:hypothetical protein
MSNGKISRRGTPNTVHPKIGVGSHREHVERLVSEAEKQTGDGGNVVFNPGFLSNLDPAALNGHPMVKQLAELTAKRLLQQHAIALMSVMGLRPAEVAAILRTVADETAAPG